MVLSTEWSQVEVIDLVNDGSGLGFGIVGGRSTGVVVKSILPGGIADRDGRLQSGDHILQINDVQTRGLGSEHVATVLRQSGAQVRMIVARPVEPTSCDYRALGSHAPIVPTKTLTDPEELEILLLQNGYPENFEISSPIQEYDQYDQSKIELTTGIASVVVDTYPPAVTVNSADDGNQIVNDSSYLKQPEINLEDESPESENVIVVLEKNLYGLGITVAGYVWEREELSGIFVKGISEGSAADLSGQIHLNDRIVEVDGKSLRGVTNHEAVEMLRRTGKTVKLSLERYLRGPRYEHLQNALQADNVRPTISPPSPSVTTLSWFPVQTDVEIEPEPESHTTIDSNIFEPPDPDTIEVFVDTHFESGSVTPDLDMAVKKKWHGIVGSDTEIVVAQLRKLRGLGISLEGTVDVEDGIELRPRHYIRSILPEGPVGRNGKLSSGDELLEVNGQKLLGRNHVDVVKILKELPETVRIVCARNSTDSRRVINTSQDREGFAARNILSGSLRTLLNETEQNNIKEELSLNTSSTATLAEVNNELTDGLSSEAIENTNSISSKQIVLVHQINDDCNEIGKCNSNCTLDSDTNCDIDENQRVYEVDKNFNHAEKDEIELQESEKEISEEKNIENNDDAKNITNNIDDDDDNKEIIEFCKQSVDESPENDKNISNNKLISKNTALIIKRNNSQDSDDSLKLKHTKMERRKSRSLEAITYLAIWKNETEIIELYKGNKGLGFSILDYQDPLDPNGTVIVVRSLVPNGSAELDGRLRPGDRIMSVNDISLKNVSLDDAVKALKGTPVGKVRIGYSKPMPLTKDDDPSSPLNLKDNYFIW